MTGLNVSCLPKLATLVVCAMTLIMGSAHAQFRAGLQGTVTDPAGAAIPEANVTLTNTETGQERQVATDGRGNYYFERLSPGRYELAVEAAGFKQKKLENVTVSAEQLQGVNVQLDLGAVQETVTVSDTTLSLLQTESASVEGTITNEELLRLPQTGRDAYELMRLAPGAFGLGARSGAGGSVEFPNTPGPGGSDSSIFQTENQPSVSADGQRVTANNFEIDGMSVNSQVWGGAAVVTPNQESVKEVRVVSNSYSAETGRNSGALVQVVSRNGTNEFHGSAVWKVNDPTLNAFNKWGGPFGGTPQRVETDQNQYAGSLGGPIVKNKLFFFFSYETIRNSTTDIDRSWIETPEFRSLVASQRAGSLANQIVNFPGMDFRIQSVLDRDCASVELDASNCQATPGGLDIGSPTGSPGQQIESALGGGLDGIPDLQFAETLRPRNNTAQQFNGRLDYQVTDNDLVAFSMYYTPNESESLNGGREAQRFSSNRLNTAGSLLWNRTITPTMLNEARFNVTRWTFDEIESNPELPWGIPNVRVADNPFPFEVMWGVPGAGVFYQTTYNFRDILSRVTGGHNLKFGVDLNFEQNNDTLASSARPMYRFIHLWDFLNDAAVSENGFFDPRTGFPTNVKKYVRSNIYSLFVQDDWKILPNLTLNLGVRWEYFTPLREQRGNISNLIPGEGADTLLNARIVTGGNLWEPDRNNLAPQIGFAWNPKAILGREFDNRLVIRGGFGMGYNRVPMSLTLNGRENPPFFGNFTLEDQDILYTLGNELTSFEGWPSNPATILTFDQNNIPTSGSPVNVFAIPEKFPTPYSMRYSLDVQYDLGSNWVASIGYLGSSGHKFPRRVNYSLFFPPNPRLNAVRFVNNDVNSNFNALLTRLTHRFAKGFTLNAQYRWSKSIDTCSNDNSCPQTFPFDLRQERGPSDFDVSHYFTLSGLWDLPILRNRSDWIAMAFDNWQLNGIVTLASGFPWTPVYNDPNCATRESTGGLCPLRPIAYLGGAGDDLGNDTFLQENGNFPGGGLAFFTSPADDSNLNLPPVPGVGRNNFRGPRYFGVDLSASKRVPLPFLPLFGESTDLDLRVNAFNVFNTLNLTPFAFNSASTQINSGTFGQPESALSGRVVEFQVRFQF